VAEDEGQWQRKVAAQNGDVGVADPAGTDPYDDVVRARGAEVYLLDRQVVAVLEAKGSQHVCSLLVT